MNNRNEFTELSISHHLALSQIAKDLLEINQKIEKVNSRKRTKTRVSARNILNLFIKLLA